jgi:hypothetical protein
MTCEPDLSHCDLGQTPPERDEGVSADGLVLELGPVEEIPGRASLGLVDEPIESRACFSKRRTQHECLWLDVQPSGLGHTTRVRVR